MHIKLLNCYLVKSTVFYVSWSRLYYTMETGNLLLPFDGFHISYSVLSVISVFRCYFAYKNCAFTQTSVLPGRPDTKPISTDYWYFLFSCLVCVIDIFKNSDKLRRAI